MKVLLNCYFCLQKRYLMHTYKHCISTCHPLSKNNQLMQRSRIKKIQLRDKDNFKICTAFSTGESYNLEQIHSYFSQHNSSYVVGTLPNDASDVLHVKKQTNDGDVFLFRRLGAFVCWNIQHEEISCLRSMLKEHEKGSYSSDVIDKEFEQLNYMDTTDENTSLIDGDILLNNMTSPDKTALEKLTFSNAMALSVKLDIWESSLEEFSESLRYVPEVLKRGFKVGMTRSGVLRKIGELLTLRHQINLYSDLLTTPDFYWDREDLEKLYTKTCNYLEISKRTTVMNEKLNLCSELVEMLRSHLNDEHSHRLEWMIIALITIEVLFEVIRLAERLI